MRAAAENNSTKSLWFLLCFHVFLFEEVFPPFRALFPFPSCNRVTTAGVKAARVWLHPAHTSPAEIKESVHRITVLVRAEMYRPKWDFTLRAGADLSPNRGEIPQAYGKSSAWCSRSPGAFHQALGVPH